MIDNQNIAELVQQQIQHAVDRYVITAMADQQWQTAIEQQITDFVKDRITARFQNIEAIPAVQAMIQHNVQQMFAQGQIPGIGSFVDKSHITAVIDAAVQNFVSSSLGDLVLDEAWINKIQTHVESNMCTRISEQLSAVDVNTVIAQEVRNNVDRWRSELGRNFSSTGIRDLASDCELMISDGAVVVQSGFAANTVLVEQHLTTQDLIVTGTVNTDCESWSELADTVAHRTQALLGTQWQAQLVQEVLSLAKAQGIDFESVTVQGSPLVQGAQLNNSVTETSIQKLGVLRDLSVIGPVHMAHTLHVQAQRVGVNTETPDMALTIWDEEISLSLGKISRDRAWIGSNRDQALDIGTNRKRAISIEPDGLVVLDQLRIDRWRIAFANAVPNHGGTRGDVVINHDPKPGTAFAWQCLGGFKWQAVHTT